MPLGRNDRCHCGSGKKFKHCCGGAGSVAAASRLNAPTLASRFYEAGKFAEAATEYQLLVANDPANARLALRLGTCQLQAEQVAAAITSFAAAIARDPHDDAMHNNLGFAYLQQSQYARAVESFRQAITLKPSNASAQTNLGDALGASGQLEASIACYRQASAIEPRNAEALFNLGRALMQFGDAPAAIIPLRAVVALAPQASVAWQWLADAYADAAAATPRRMALDDAAVEADLLGCLSRRDIEPAFLAPTISSVLRRCPAFSALLIASDTTVPLVLDDATAAVIAKPLWLKLLENTVVADGEFERLVTRTRRRALLGERPLRMAVLVAIAQQCHLAE